MYDCKITHGGFSVFKTNVQSSHMSYIRPDSRQHNQLRPLRITPHVFGYAPSSILFEMGNTKVLCSVSIAQGVPPFLKGKKEGWLTAEYAMLPTATMQRTQRESSSNNKNGRSIEISRLIGRVLRTMVNLQPLGERTITIDCDVLQADGGTRIAAINGAALALKKAIEQWLADGLIGESILIDYVAAVSVGSVQGSAVLDLDYHEDSTGDADFNFVLTRSGEIVEVQGCSEKKPIAWQHFDEMRTLAIKGAQDILAKVESFEAGEVNSNSHVPTQEQKKPLFSLANRFGQAGK